MSQKEEKLATLCKLLPFAIFSILFVVSGGLNKDAMSSGLIYFSVLIGFLFANNFVAGLARKLSEPFHSKPWYMYEYEIEKLSSLFPKFINKILSKEQVLKLKDENGSNAQIFKLMLNDKEDKNMSISYGEAMHIL